MGKRMYYIFKIIQNQEGQAISGKEILKQLQEYDIDINIKTVYTCVRHLNAFFHDWFHQDVIVTLRKQGFRIQQEFFTDGELQFLLDQIASHQDLHFEDKHKLKDQILLLSSKQQQDRLLPFRTLPKDLSFSLFLNLSTIMKAIESQSALVFQYISYKVKNQCLQEVVSQNGNDHDQYMISPYHIVSQDNHYYLIAYNQKYKDQLTTYRIDRMRMVRISQKQFVDIREQFDMQAEIDQTIHMYMTTTRDRIELECDQRILREVVSRFGHNLQAKALYHEKYLITIDDIAISEGLIGWIMMMQDHVKVIHPLSLQKVIKDRVQKVACLYEDQLY